LRLLAEFTQCIVGRNFSSPLGDPPALPGRQQEFDSSRSIRGELVMVLFSHTMAPGQAGACLHWGFEKHCELPKRVTRKMPREIEKRAATS
jgi:hypothetical protein